MDIKVPLKQLKFGHTDGEGINARVAGREDGIAALAANIFANRSDENPSGLIENLIVKDAGAGFYSVANGNRRLAALHMMDGADSEMPIGCTLHAMDETKAFEFSLTTAITAEQLHPVDRFEALARLESRGKTKEEIAAQYGMSEKEVRQALALGQRSPKVRQAWRDGTISAEVAQAFTLSKDHKQQDRIFAKLLKEGQLGAHSVRHELGIKSNHELSGLVAFITPDLYRARGGAIVEDLFGEYHSVSDEPLVKTLATEELDRHCAELIAAGWAWAKPLDDLPAGAAHWAEKPIAEKDLIFADGEKDKIADAEKKLLAMENDSVAWDSDEQDRLEKLTDTIVRTVRGRSFNDKQKAKLGCVLDIEDGALQISYGVVKPAEPMPVKRGAAPANEGADASDVRESPPAPAPKAATTISNAMAERLETQLLHATKDALLADTVGACPVMKVLAGIVVDQIRPEQKFHMPPAVLNKLLALRSEIDGDVMNAAITKRFDAKDYFGAAPVAVVLKAVKEAINADEARKLTNSTKAEIGKFALANVVKTGWLPKELRTVHYKGPGSDGYKKPVGTPAIASSSPAPSKPKDAKKPAPKKSAAKAPLKRAASAKKATKKTSKKKR